MVGVVFYTLLYTSVKEQEKHQCINVLEDARCLWYVSVGGCGGTSRTE
jgi:hypothetical protein